MSLSDKKCVPCHGGVPALTAAEIEPLAEQVPAWEVIGTSKIMRAFTLPDFAAALELVNKIGALAEEEGHHPDINLSWGKVTVEIWTHAVGGLTESDFILAAKIDRLT
jgi:4a-hydroxytetrahydrobiopterin dehydratase